MSTATARSAWEDDPAPEFPPLDHNLDADLCVVGLGGTGLSALQEASRLGLRAVGIDAGTVAAGAAGRNGGFLLAGLPSFYHRAIAILGRARTRSLYELTMEQIDRIVEETPAAVRRVGSIRLAMSPDEETDCEEHLDALRQDGLPAAAYHGAEGRGLLIPTDAAFQPLARCRLLAARLAAKGVALHEQTAATDIAPGAVATTRGVIRAGAVLLCTDGGLTRLVPALVSRVRTARLQMLATAPEPAVSVPRPAYARYGMEYWQQLPGGEIVLGGFRDAGGEAEWTTDTTPSGAVQEALESFLRGVLGVTAPVTHRWAASVGYTADELPVLEEVAPGVWAMGGYNGTGNLIGALCGRAAVELALHGQSEIGSLLGARQFG